MKNTSKKLVGALLIVAGCFAEVISYRIAQSPGTHVIDTAVGLILLVLFVFLGFDLLRSAEQPGSDSMADMIPASPIGRQPPRVWRIVLGVVLTLIGLINSDNVETAPDLGALTGVVALVALAVWLIASGLPRSIGSEDLKRLRRQIWYKLAGLGLLVMILLAGGLLAVSQITASVLVAWAYWFGWTWISWLIADRRALRHLQPPTA